MIYSCPECEEYLKSEFDSVGSRVRCPFCHATITVPNPPELEAETIAMDDAERLGETLPMEETSPPEVSLPGEGGHDADSPTFGIGETRYTVGDELARGGMGAVMLAEDLNIHREVALKRMLDPAAAGPDETRRFLEEAQITGQLEHPGIVPVHELGIDEEGRAYYTMKRIQGVSLHEILDKLREKDQEAVERWTLQRLLRAFGNVCDAVAFAHSRGVVHRDLKPANVMLGEFGEVLVVDWGIAKILDREDGASSNRAEWIRVAPGEGDSFSTLQGQIFGTPHYMAPEQALGKVDRIGPTTDIFALGGILYELLTLRPPITGKTVHEALDKAATANIPNLMRMHSRATIQWPERPHCPVIPESLKAVCMKALSRKQEDRYPDVPSLRAEVDSYLNGFATAAERAGFGRQLSLFVARNKSVCLAIAAGILVLACVVSAAAVINLREQAKRLGDRKRSAPALLETARNLMFLEEWDQAMTVTDSAIDFDPDFPEARLQKAVLHLRQRNFSEATKALQAYASAPEASNLNGAIRLMAFSEAAAGAPPGQRPLREIGAALRALEFPGVAAEFVTQDSELLSIWSEKLESAWGRDRWNLRHEPEDGLVLGVERDLTDLSPVRGIPINSLRIASPVTNLTPLSGLQSLREVTFTVSAPVSDLEPLRGLPLESLSLENTGIREFGALDGAENLRTLSIQIDDADDLKPLSGLKVEDLTLIGDRKPVGGSLEVHPEVLGGLKLTRLTTQYLDFSEGGLDTEKLEEVSIRDTGTDLDLGGFAGPVLRTMTISGNHEQTSLRPLGKSPLEQLTINELRKLETLEGLSGHPSLRHLTVGGYSIPFDQLVAPPLPALQTLKIGGMTRPVLLPEPEDFPALRSLQVGETSLLLTGVLVEALARDDFDSVERELERIESVCAPWGEGEEPHPAIVRLRADIGAWRKDERSLLGNFLPRRGVFGGHAYALINGGAQSWKASRRYAEKLGGHLVAIESEEENTFLREHFEPSAYNNRIFIGLFRPARGEEFRWVNGEALVYENWGESGPPRASSGDELAVNFADQSWSGVQMDQRQVFLVEWED